MLTKEELDQINRFSKAELTADQVYTFSVRLCDNEVDRDFERYGPYLPDGGGAGTGHRDGGGG